jgi:hypothetical protein
VKYRDGPHVHKVRCGGVTGAAGGIRYYLLKVLSRVVVLRLHVAYLRWLDVHAVSRTDKQQGQLALGQLDVVPLCIIAGLHSDGSADGFGITIGRYLVDPDLKLMGDLPCGGRESWFEDNMPQGREGGYLGGAGLQVPLAVAIL